MATLRKDPDALLDYGFDWAPWLGDDTIAESTWTATDGIAVETGRSEHTDKTTTVWLSGGVAGVRYRVTNRIVTAAGRRDDRTLVIDVAQK